MVNIKLENISKSYGKFKAVENINLEIKDNEYFIILGPTGGGKTTLLKIIAGLIKTDIGKIYFDDKDVTSLSPGERNLGFMFENYALFPHMNLFENISYSSRVHARDHEQTKQIVDQILMMTLLTGRNEALPDELSGGMQQRVALSRALMNLEQTKLLILDEPLKALDAGLRMSLRRELLLMAKSPQLELTVIHVTNEEQEAMMLADRVAVIDNGKVVQVGSPHEIYYHPANLFVANFMSEINYFEGKCIVEKPSWDIFQKSKRGDKFYEEIYEDSVPITLDMGEESHFAAYVEKSECEDFKSEKEIILVVRSNHFKIRLGNRKKQKNNSFLGKIQRRKFMGVFYRFEVLIKFKGREKIVVVSIPATSEIHENFLEGAEVTIYFPKELGIVFRHPGKEVIEKVLKLQ